MSTTRSSYTNITLVVVYLILMFQASNKLSSTLNATDFENAVDMAAWATDKNNKNGRLPTLEYLTGNPKHISCPSPLIPVYDRIVEDIYFERKIPRAIHVSMKSRCMPPDLAVAPAAWKEALPHHSFYFHDDDAVARLFNLEFKEFPQLKSMLRCIQFKGAMLIDVWRVLILYVFGGIYTDIESMPTSAFNELSPITAEDEFFVLSDAWDRPSQWFFAMEPKHPIGYYIMYEIFKRLQDLQDIQKPKVVFVTGPEAFKHGYGNALGWPDNLFGEGKHVSKKFNKTATKVKKNIYVESIDFGKNVTWNDKENITVRERIERQSGVIHWTKQVHWNKKSAHGSCLDFIYLQDNNLITRPDSTMELQETDGITPENATMKV